MQPTEKLLLPSHSPSTCKGLCWPSSQALCLVLYVTSFSWWSLGGCCTRFALVLAWRFLLWCLPQKRSVEDLKERYYHICAKLANIRAAPGTDLKIPVFDAGHERRRKEQLERLYNRTPEQVNWGREHHCSKRLINWILYDTGQRVGKVKKGWTRHEQYLSTAFVVGLMSL